jgi:hypothetical protein
LGIVSERKRDRNGVALRYKEMAGFEIYVEEENCSDLKRVILHF